MPLNCRNSLSLVLCGAFFDVSQRVTVNGFWLIIRVNKAGLSVQSWAKLLY